MQKKQRLEPTAMSSELHKAAPWVLAVLAMLCAVLPCAAGGEAMTAEEVFELLPKGADVDDNAEIANYLKLVEQGEAIYGILLDMVRTQTNTLIASRALSVLCEAQGDKHGVVAELGRIVDEKRSLTGSKNELMLMVLSKAISDMGEPEDVPLLSPLLTHPSADVRETASYYAEKLASKVPSRTFPATGGAVANPEDSGDATEPAEP